MSLSTIRQTLMRLLEANIIGKSIRVLWHAGEPLTLAAQYYREAFQLIRSLLPGETVITHAMQTNGTLIDDEWCFLFKEYGVEVGVSIDGPEKIHNKNRVTRTGVGTFDLTLRGCVRMKEYGLPIRTISVVTDMSLEDPKGFLEFFDWLGADHVALNVEEVEGVNHASSIGSVESEFKEFFKSLFRLYTTSEYKFRLRERESAIRALKGFSRTKIGLKRRSQQTVPYRIMTVAHDGDFSTFSPELLGFESEKYGKFVLGNVYTNSIIDTFSAGSLKRIHSDILLGVENCRQSCEFFALCGGGVPANKFFELGTLTGSETLHCRTHIQSPLLAQIENLEESIV